MNNNGEQNKKKKIGRPKTLPTMKDIYEELEIVIEECEACGAKPATFCHYANGRTLCHKCSRPAFRRHWNKLLGGAGAIILGVILYNFI